MVVQPNLGSQDTINYAARGLSYSEMLSLKSLVKRLNRTQFSVIHFKGHYSCTQNENLKKGFLFSFNFSYYFH